MPSIILVGKDGTHHELNATEGESLMETVVNAGIRGITAECGGAAACATCHVYVVGGPTDCLPPIDVLEDELLDGVAADRLAGSRLSCQIPLTEALNGLIVRVPVRQV
jgi:2Fe-2S ferredoxin